MKKLLMITGVCAALAFTGCKGNPNTASGDSTGTGAAGARVPGNTTADTTHHDTTKNALSTGIDSSKNTKDTAGKGK